jgi:monoterpene epsilon-lactone hydrolase
MATESSQPLSEHYAEVAAALRADPPTPLDQVRDLVEHWGDVSTEPGGVDYLEVDAAAPSMWIIPHDAAEDRVLLCLHGGGFIGGSIYTHRKMFAHLAKAAGARALSVNYRRTPEHSHPAPLDDAFAAYSWLLEKGYDAQRIALAGDSAGGGLTVTTMLRARERGLPLAAALMPLSPWFDMELAGETITSNQPTDVLFGGPEPMNLQLLVHMFLGEGGDRRDPLASPLHADLSGLPPIYIQVGGAEMLLDDSQQFYERAQAAGIDVRLDVFAGQQHTFHMSVGRAPEADDAIARLAEWVRPRIGLAEPVLATAAT